MQRVRCIEGGSSCRSKSRRINCHLSDAVWQRFYDASPQTWTLNSELLEELENDVQLLIDCTGNSETVLVATGIVLKPSSVVRIERPIRIVGDDSEGRVPRWTCGTSEDRNQIAVISDVANVTFSGIHFVECDASAGSSPIVMDRSNVSFMDCRFEANRGNSGGVISARMSTLGFTSCDFAFNQAEIDGGSIFAYDRSMVVVNGCLFEENMSKKQGGSIRLLNGTSASLMDSLFLRNTAESGGAVHATSFEEFAQIEMEGCECVGNQATFDGGAFTFEASEFDEDESTHIFSMHGEDRHAKEIVNQARRRMGSPVNPDSEELIQLFTMTISNSVFESNEAGEMGGAAAVLVGALVWVENSIFSNNKAGTSSGATYFLRSLFFCDYCMFNNNTAGASGGAVMIHGVAFGTHHGSHICEGTVRHSSFVNNACSNHGGGVLVDGLEAYFYAVENVTYQGNNARAGGGVAAGNAAFVNITSASFLQNRAMDGGGALSLSFLQFRYTRCAISNVKFIENDAATGGALFAEFYLYVDIKMEQTHFGDQSLENPSIQMNHTTFSGNSAVTGGAMELNGVPALLRNISMEGNRAEDVGGALALVGLSVVQVVGGRFHGNEAKSGGALMVRERCVMHCVGCEITNNRATENGGGVCIVCLFVEKQPVVFECDACSVKENRALIGGGLHLNHKSVPRGSDLRNLPIVVLKNLDLMDNYARVGGGGIMASHPAQVAVQCSGQVEEPTSKNLTDGLIKINEVHKMQRLSQKACPAWNGNSVGREGYGPMKATFASTANICVIEGKECRMSYGMLPVHSSAGLIPPIRISLVDMYGQSPAEPLPGAEHFTIIPQSSDVRLSGQLETHFSRGKASLTETTVTGNPGGYSLSLHFLDKTLEDIHLYTELRECSIGEQSVLDNTACQRCEAGTYSVQEPLDKCTECHGSCICRKWGIAPKSGHWIPSPCVTQAKECLSDNACTYNGREEAMDEFFDTHKPTCDLSDEDKELFHSKQCSEGHQGLLCGSCSKGYGGGVECYQCMGRLMIVALLLLNLCWFFILAAIAIRGNLSISKPQTELDQLRFEEHDVSVQSMLEMYFTGNIQRPSISQRLNNLSKSSVGSSQRLNNSSSSSKLIAPPTTTMSECEAAKKNVAERFKLFVNFAQVNSMALIITTDWTKAAEEMLTILDFTGAVSAEAAITLDCLFSGSCSVPRSVSKTIMSLVLPFILLMILALFWSARHFRNLQLLKRRLMLSLLIVLYISYIGIARRVFSVLYCVRIHDGRTLEDSTNKLYWTQDTSVVCYEGSHLLLLASLALPLILLILLAFPIASAMFLFVARKNQSLDTIELKETFGFMFQAYKEEYVFWDCTILFRKAALALVVIFGGTLGGNMQGLIAVCILGLSFYLHMTFLPYNETFDSLNVSEKFSLSVSLITFLSGVFVGSSSITPGGRVFCSVVVLMFNLSFVLYSVKDIYLSALKFFRLKLEEDNVPINKEEVHFKLVAMWLRHQCTEILNACHTRRH